MNLLTSQTAKVAVKREMDNKAWVPSEYHGMNILYESDNDLIVSIVGGHYKESSYLSRNNNSVKIVHFFKEDEELRIKHINQFSSFRHHLKTNRDNAMAGSYLPSLCMSSTAVVGMSLYMYGGFDSTFDKCISEIYCLSYQFDEGDIIEDDDDYCAIIFNKCTQIPSEETVLNSGVTCDEAHNFRVQGNVHESPGERMGHKMFPVDNENFIVIGGHNKKWERSGFHLSNYDDNAFVYNITTDVWKKCMSTNEVDIHNVLKRSLFSGVRSSDGVIYICGGNIYHDDSKTVEKLSMCNVVSVTVIIDEIVLVTVKEVFYTLHEVLPNNPSLCISGASMTCKFDKLFFYGGNHTLTADNHVQPCNNNLFIANMSSYKIEMKIPPVNVEYKLKVHGSSSVWFGDHSLILMGGSLPPKGYRGRSYIFYTRLSIIFVSCNAKKCLVTVDYAGSRNAVECEQCKKWIHTCCDSKVKKMSVPALRALHYICPLCSREKAKLRKGLAISDGVEQPSIALYKCVNIGGKKKLSCQQCQFTTEFEASMKGHITKRHK